MLDGFQGLEGDLETQSFLSVTRVIASRAETSVFIMISMALIALIGIPKAFCQR